MNRERSSDIFVNTRLEAWLEDNDFYIEALKE